MSAFVFIFEDTGVTNPFSNKSAICSSCFSCFWIRSSACSFSKEAIHFLYSSSLKSASSMSSSSVTSSSAPALLSINSSIGAPSPTSILLSKITLVELLLQPQLEHHHNILHLQPQRQYLRLS